MSTTPQGGDTSMSKLPRMVVQITGPEAEATAAVLAARLSELGQEGREDGADVGFTPIAASAEALEPMACTVDQYDAPDFAAEKILDMLEKRGVVRLDASEVSAEEEARMEDRLNRLGYLD